MAFDQEINYRVNVDDSNFQAKLTQMRASLDSAVGGGGGFGGANMYGMMSMMNGAGSGQAMQLGGLSDFGSMVRPVTYTPPAIAMQPHFGMYQIQQSLGQAGLTSAFGPAVGTAVGGFMRGGFRGMMNSGTPENISSAEYMAQSSKQFGAAAGDALAVGGMTVASATAGMLAGSAGYAMGAAMFANPVGMMVAGALGATALSMAPAAYFGAVTDYMAENRQMQSTLQSGSFRFMTGGQDVDKLTGRGMSLDAKQRTAKALQGMEMNDLRYGAGEYQQVLEGGMQMDLFSGTKDVEDFKGKFKGLVENLKTVTSTLHTSLKEGLEVIRGMRDMGVTDPGEVNRLTLGSEMRGRTSGRTGMEMMAIGQAGAEIFRGTGIDMGKGFELNQMNLQQVRSGLNNGLLSRESVAQAGGETALAQQLTAGNLASFQTSYGRASMMANYNPATGQMNPNMMQNLMTGNTLQNIAGATHLGAAGMISFQAHQEEIISKMSPEAMQAFGIAGRMGMAKHLSSAFGVNAEDAFRVASQREGRSKSQIDADLAFMHQDPQKFKENQEAAMESMRTQAAMEDLRNKFSPVKAVKNWWNRNVVAPVGNIGTAISGGIESAVESAELGIMGITVGDTRGITSGVIAEGEKVLAKSSGRGVLLDARGTAYQRHILGQNAEGLMKNLEEGAVKDEKTGEYTYQGTKVGLFKTEAEARAAAEQSGQTVQLLGMSNKFGGGDYKFVTMSSDSVKKVSDTARGMQVTAAEAKAVENKKLDMAIGSKLAGLDDKAGLEEAVSTFSGGKFTLKDLKTMSDDDFKKKFDLNRGEQKAMLQRNIETFTGLDSKVRKDWKREQDTSSLGDASANASADALEKAQAAKKVLINAVTEVQGESKSSHWGKGKEVAKDKEGNKIDLEERLKDDPELLQGLLNADKSVADKTALARSKGIYGIDETIKNISKSGKTYDLALQDFQVLAKQSAEAKAAAGGGDGKSVGGKVSGDVSKETSVQLKQAADQLITIMKTLQTMQDQLNKSVAAGGGH